jgi:hypothetical protein
VISFFVAAWLAASPPPLDYVVTDREGHTWVGSTSEPDADPLVLQTPNGPISIPRADVASTAPFVLPPLLSAHQCVCGCPVLGRIDQAPEFFSVLAGSAVALSVRVRDRWIAEVDQSFVPYQSSSRPALGLFGGYALMVWDRRKHGGRTAFEIPIQTGYRDERLGDQLARYRGIAGLVGLNCTFWFATRPGLRLQLLFGKDQWLGRRPAFTDGDACDCPPGTSDPIRLTRVSDEFRVAAGFAF